MCICVLFNLFYQLYRSVRPQNDLRIRNTQRKIPHVRCHFDNTVHSAACLHTGIVTNQVFKLRTRRTIINLKKRNKEYDVIESVEITSISAHMNYEWRELVFCAGMGFDGNFPKSLDIFGNGRQHAPLKRL